MKYAAVINNVHEVTLWGSAKLNFWKEHLKNFDFYPYVENRKAVIIISAINSKFKGIKFSELSVSLKISFAQNGKGDDGFYLFQAYNNVRLFSFIERKIFKTPYYTGKIILNNNIPPKLTLTANGLVILEFEMGNKKTLNEVKVEQHEFKILLPGNGEKNYFHANLEGMTYSFNFTPNDKIIINENAEGVWKLLKESGYTPLTWKIRNDSIHRKTKTFTR